MTTRMSSTLATPAAADIPTLLSALLNASLYMNVIVVSCANPGLRSLSV
jgi:hypothetical protein